MVDKDKIQEIPAPERKASVEESEVRFDRQVTQEKREMMADDKIVSAELRREVEMMQLDENTKKDAEKKAEKIGFLGEKEKIEHLLQIARKKGIVYAIHIVRQMNEPYLLDILHDTLAQEGFYKKIGQTDDDSQTVTDDDDDVKNSNVKKKI